MCFGPFCSVVVQKNDHHQELHCGFPSVLLHQEYTNLVLHSSSKHQRVCQGVDGAPSLSVAFSHSSEERDDHFGFAEPTFSKQKNMKTGEGVVYQE